MLRLLTGLLICAVANLTAAASLVEMVRAEDQRRVCLTNEGTADARVIRRDAAFILRAANIAPDTIKVHVCKNEWYASAATTLYTVVLSPDVASLPRNERFFVLAHEIGHLANLDSVRWGRLETPHTALTEQAVWDASLDMEIAADRWAAKLLVELDIDPVMSATGFFARRGVLDLPGTSSHPAAKTRLAEIASAINTRASTTFAAAP
jgi:hypothetical protein